jgi:hypothetical protein
MFRKLVSVAVFGIVASVLMVATGCTNESSPKPYSVTGDDASSRADWLNPKYQDSKGHYRPELTGAPGY